MKKKLATIIFIPIILCGCKSGKVDYNINSMHSDNQMQITDATELNNLEWKEDIKTMDSDGKDIVLKINLKTSVLTVEKKATLMSFNKKQITSDYKAQIVKAYFGSNTVYCWDEDKIPSNVLNKMLEKCKKDREECETDNNDEGILEYDEKIEKYENLIKNANDNLIEATEYSGNEYLGYIDGVPYNLSFSSEEYEGIRHIYIGSYPEEYLFDENEVEDVRETMSLDQKKTIAENFLREIGIDEPIFYDEETEDDGTFVFSQGDMEALVGDYRFYEICSNAIHINDNGNVTCIDIYDPCGCNNFLENVKMLSFSDIQSIIRTEITQNYGDYKLYCDENSTLNMTPTAMYFGYSIIEGDDKNEISFVPTWYLEDVIYVNAIDGSIIKPSIFQ